MSKGSRVRPHNKEKFDRNYACVFGKKRLNVWQDAPSKEELGDEEERAGTNQSVRRENRERTN